MIWHETGHYERIQNSQGNLVMLDRAQGLVTIFIFFPSTLKTTREESKMSNFHTTLFQNSFVLVS